MVSIGFTSSDRLLLEAAKAYFKKAYGSPLILEDVEIGKDLKWKPTLQVKVHNHLTIIAEVSETPYPGILSARRRDLRQLEMPISVFSICPEEACLQKSQQTTIKKLQSHGYGLIQVDDKREASLRFTCIPIIQQISDDEFNTLAKNISSSHKVRIAQAFLKYKHDPVTGVQEITETIEGMVLQAGREAVKKSWIEGKKAKPGFAIVTLEALMETNDGQKILTSLESVSDYYKEYRNISHHFPQNKAQAFKRYRKPRSGFLEGIQTLNVFREATKKIGLTGKFPNL